METVAAKYRAAKQIERHERQRLRLEVTLACRAHLEWLARTLAPGNELDAEVIGAIGVIVALEKYDAERDGAFWPFARPFVCDEIRRWLDDLDPDDGPDGDDGEAIPEDDAVWMRRAA
jgi:DNA-directed RNA polymerase specialized sigma subunit